MGKGQSPTPSELEFIYELFDKGYSDTDVLAEYQKLKEHGMLGKLPLREDIRFIRQRRKEFETSQRIIKSRFNVHTVPDYVIKHWNDLANIAHKLTDFRKAFLKAGTYSNRDEYVVDIGSPEFEHFIIDNGYFAQHLLIHLKAEYPDEYGDISSWKELLRLALPEECLGRLLDITYRGTFESTTCDICEGWRQK